MKIKSNIYNHILIVCAASLAFILTLGITRLLKSTYQRNIVTTQAKEDLLFNTSNMSADSSIVNIGGQAVSRITLNSLAPLLQTYDSPSTLLTILQTLENTTVPNQPENQPILPRDFSKSARLLRIVEEGKLKLHPNAAGTKNYIYQQNLNVNDTLYPVLGAVVRLDVKNNTQLTGMGATIVNFNDISTGDFKREDAEVKALALAQRTTKQNLVLCRENPDPMTIVNKSLLGVDTDPVSYLTHAVDICSTTEPIVFHKRYYVDTITGVIIHSENKIINAVDRRIFDCTDMMQTNICVRKRKEGEPPVGGEFDRAYDALGAMYTFWKDKFGRDGMDNAGRRMIADLNYEAVEIDENGVRHPFCPNASFSDISLDTIFCAGLATLDIVGHEIAHGLTHFTAKLLYENQSGAINESISDIFGHSIDREDWIIGEDYIQQGIRRMDAPERSIQAQPSKLFSPRFYCMPSQCLGNPAARPAGCDNLQNRYVHVNSGVLNYAYYLMVTGGSFNGCTVVGIGEDKAIAIIYRALTSYLQPTSNLKDTYNAVNKACEDLYGRDSYECKQATMSMQAVEIDQQQEGTQVASSCPNGARQPAQATCAGVVVPTPTGTEPTPTGIDDGARYCAPPQPGLLNNSKEKTAVNGWFGAHKYSDCKTHNGGLWRESLADCLITDSANGPSASDRTIINDPQNLYYKHLTPEDGLELIPANTIADILAKLRDPNQVAAAKQLLTQTVRQIVDADPQRAGVSSFDSLYLGLENGRDGNPVRSASLMVHPIVERIISDKITIDERVKKLYQPYVEAFIGKSVALSDVKELYVAALNKCGGGAINGDQSGKGLLKDFGDYVGVVQFWSDAQEGVFSEFKDCNIHLVKKIACAVVPTATPGNPTATPGGPTATPGGPTPATGQLNLKIFLKLQGIYRKPASPRDRMNIKIGLLNETMRRPEYKQVEFTSDNEAVWEGNTTFNLPDGNYFLYVKGPNHLQKKVGDRIPHETYPGTYQTHGRRISLSKGDTTLDLSDIYQPACDIKGPSGEQDGICNSYDITKVRSMYGSHSELCDLNRDGTCNTQDHALQIETLQIRFDQE